MTSSEGIHHKGKQVKVIPMKYLEITSLHDLFAPNPQLACLGKTVAMSNKIDLQERIISRYPLHGKFFNLFINMSS